MPLLAILYVSAYKSLCIIQVVKSSKIQLDKADKFCNYDHLDLIYIATSFNN